jgi:hypothetical protein
VCDFGGPTERVRLVGVSISFEKNFYRLPFTPPLSGRLIGPSPTSPTTRVAMAPEKARPRRRTVAATMGMKWPGPLPSKDDPQAARASGSKNLTLEGCDYRPVALKPTQRERVPQVPSIYEKLRISGSRAGAAENPRNLQMRKDGGTQLPLRNGPTDQGFKT